MKKTKKSYSSKRNTYFDDLFSKDKRNKLTLDLKKKVDSHFSTLKRGSFEKVDDLISKIGDEIDDIQALIDQYYDDNANILDVAYRDYKEDKPGSFFNKLVENNQILGGPSLGEIFCICDKGKTRYKDNVPPGYKDSKNKEGIRQYADLIWWQEIINFARDNRKNIIVVTNDAKSDWWGKDENDKPVLRKELIDEFAKETKYRNKGDSTKSNCQIFAFNSNDFYELLANKFEIQKTDTLDIVIGLTSDEYINSIKEWVFEDIWNELCFSGEKYLEDDAMNNIGTEGVDEWELDDYSFETYEVINQDNDYIDYLITYNVEMSGASYDYLGKDNESDEVYTSGPIFQKIKGIVNVKTRRPIYGDIDFADNDYVDSEIESASFNEISCDDKRYEDDYDDDLSALNTCPECEKPLTDENMAGNGFCISCSRNRD